jgi:hypothetical protein
VKPGLLGESEAEHARMELAILLSVAASFCTATSSVCQRLGARTVKVTGFDPWLVFRLARQRVLRK